MAFTYDVTTDRGKVRLRIGDTDTTDQQLQDAEIDYFLELAGDNILLASINAAQALVAKYARQVSTSVESVSVQAAERHKNYVTLLDQLESEYSKRGAIPMPYVGGVSVSAMDTRREDKDRVPATFEKNQFKNATTLDNTKREDLE